MLGRQYVVSQLGAELSRTTSICKYWTKFGSLRIPGALGQPLLYGFSSPQLSRFSVFLFFGIPFVNTAYVIKGVDRVVGRGERLM